MPSSARCPFLSTLSLHDALPIYEDDAGSILLALDEQVPHPRGADADEHLDEVRARDGKEGHARLAGDGPGEERLPGARGADQQQDRKSTRLNSSHITISYAVFCSMPLSLHSVPTRRSSDL